MIVMSASQLKPDAASIIEELCSIIDVKQAASVALEKSEESKEVKSDRFRGEKPVEEINQIF